MPINPSIKKCPKLKLNSFLTRENRSGRQKKKKKKEKKKKKKEKKGKD